jgi:hypothetical protein
MEERYEYRARELHVMIEEARRDAAIESGVDVSAWQAYREKWRGPERELQWILQRHVRRAAMKVGIEIPADKYESFDAGKDTDQVLTSHGEAWLYRHVNAYKMDRTKGRVAIIIPILSLVVTVLALLVALKKK